MARLKLRPEVLQFAELMERTLRKDDHNARRELPVMAGNSIFSILEEGITKLRKVWRDGEVKRSKRAPKEIPSDYAARLHVEIVVVANALMMLHVKTIRWVAACNNRRRK